MKELSLICHRGSSVPSSFTPGRPSQRVLRPETLLFILAGLFSMNLTKSSRISSSFRFSDFFAAAFGFDFFGPNCGNFTFAQFLAASGPGSGSGVFKMQGSAFPIYAFSATISYLGLTFTFQKIAKIEHNSIINYNLQKSCNFLNVKINR